ncbi:MAG TPA: hypothetical protein VG842_09205 [Sediminibacterium sp.]|nr:hypothetical protein [Sediminibacterium sp.]
MKYLFLVICLLLILLPFVMVVLNRLGMHWIDTKMYFCLAGVVLLMQEFVLNKSKGAKQGD